jgi:hypothetical protein
MLNGRPVVFLSCSEKHKATVAIPIRDGLTSRGLHAVIVSAEPSLPRTGWTVDDKVESYMNASDAFVALCTADDELADGTVQCRQNIVDEIQRARNKPHLRDKIMVLKSASVRLPSNISTVYDPLDPQDIGKAVDLVVTQLNAWGVVSASASVSPPSSTSTSIPIDRLIRGIQLGDHDKASKRAYELALETSRQGQLQVVSDLRRHLKDSTERTDVHVVASILEAIARIDPTLVPLEAIEELANSDEIPIRVAAIFMLWDLTEAAPGVVPLGIVGRLARPADEDWYVEAPAMAVTKLLMLHRQTARVIFDRLARSPDSTDRYEVAVALLDLANVDASAIPRDLATRLAQDSDELVAKKAHEVLQAIAHVDENAYIKRFRPFGI